MVRKDIHGLRPWQRWKFAKHRFNVACGRRGYVPLQLRDMHGYCLIEAPDGSVFRTSPESWVHYKRGVVGRLLQLDEAYMFGALAPPPGPVLDVGAHCGEFSLLALNRGRWGPIYAIEADPDALACLRLNLASWKNAVVVNALVSNREEELTFTLSASRADSSIFGADTPRHATGSVRLLATTLDRIAETRGIDKLAFLKCDVEGAEPEVLQGGRELLRRTARVAIDTGPERHGDRTSATCEALLRDAGFAVRTRASERNRIMTYGSRDGVLPEAVSV